MQLISCTRLAFDNGLGSLRDAPLDPALQKGANAALQVGSQACPLDCQTWGSCPVFFSFVASLVDAATSELCLLLLLLSVACLVCRMICGCSVHAREKKRATWPGLWRL
jgi:hypothetical protein